MSTKNKNVCVVVLGDIGRSPRMQYHSLSLAEDGHIVDIIGYGETELKQDVKTTPLLFYHYLMPCPNVPQKYLNYAFKTIWQAINLLFLLIISRKPDILLVQNPPAIPSLIICWLFARVVRSKFVIDWHNYAHTIMAMNTSKNNKLVRITKKVEAFIGKRADHNFCVTKAMKDDLSKNWNIKAITLYDRPAEVFKSITVSEKHNFLQKIAKEYKEIANETSNVFTEITADGKACLKNTRPGFLVSSTSWTEDEDFSVLFSALQEYESHVNDGNQRKLPKLVCFITGKGHLKDYYCGKIASQSWKHVSVLTPWLKPEDYPLMLASADLGVCLHTSSSGLDLPMKVVDMFGCGLPVCACHFKCLDELVRHSENGYKFLNSEELSIQLQDWFTNFPNNEEQKKIENSFRTEIETFQKLRWRENWKVNASWVFK